MARYPSGSYQGQTIQPPGNSRLVTRPDSDWLKTDVIAGGDCEQIDD